MNRALIVAVMLVRTGASLAAESCANSSVDELRNAFDGDNAFAGLYLGSDGTTAELFFVGGSREFSRLLPAARKILQSTTQVVVRAGRTEGVSMYGATILPRPVEFSLKELAEAELRVCRARIGTGAMVNASIDYQANRVIVEGSVPGLDVSGLEYVVRPYRPISATLDLRDYRRPVTAGTQISFSNYAAECTLGFVAKQGGALRHLTASHCTKNIFGLSSPSSELRQNGFTLFDGIGWEVADPPPNCTGAAPLCRRSDSVFFSAVGAASFATVAVPTSVATSANPACSTSCPAQTSWGVTMPLVPPVSSLVPGQNIEHVGRTSGRVVMQYVGSPAFVDISNHAGTALWFTILQPGRAVGIGTFVYGQSVALPGDSGGPVIQWIPTGAYVPLGLLFGASPADIGNSFVPDAYFSTLTSISSDLGAFTLY